MCSGTREPVFSTQWYYFKLNYYPDSYTELANVLLRTCAVVRSNTLKQLAIP